MKTKRYGLWYNILRMVFRLFWRRHTVRWESPRVQPAVYVSRHQDMRGPIAVGLFFPGVVRIWGYSVFFGVASCFRQYTDYTLTVRLGWPRWLAAAVAAPMALIVSAGCRSGKGIPVYRDRRVAQTLALSVEALSQGDSLAIFTDRDYQNADPAQGVGEMYSGFLHLEPKYCALTGRHVPFVPLYASRKRREMTVGTPVYFQDGEAFRAGKARVIRELQDQLNRLASVDIPEGLEPRDGG